MNTFPASPGYVVHAVVSYPADPDASAHHLAYPSRPIIAWCATEDGLVPLMLGAVWCEDEGAIRQAIERPDGTFTNADGRCFDDVYEFREWARREITGDNTPRFSQLVAAE